MKEKMFVVVAISCMGFAGNTPDGTVKLEMYQKKKERYVLLAIQIPFIVCYLLY